jgi:hypothetical protein
MPFADYPKNITLIAILAQDNASKKLMWVNYRKYIAYETLYD